MPLDDLHQVSQACRACRMAEEGSPKAQRPQWRPLCVCDGGKKVPGYVASLWLANTTFGGCVGLLESPHDETYFVRMSLPSLVACKR